MKKLLGILVLGLLWCNVAFAGSYIGEGELQLTDRIASYFAHYIKGEGRKKPSVFYVTIDGDDAVNWYCPETQCRPITPSEDIKDCERVTGKKCKMFARGKYIKWKNGINPGKGKTSKINSKWSDSEIRAKLTELGFLGNSTTTNTTGTTTPDIDIVSKIKDLKKLYDDGVLTLEEFEKAKRKLLN